MDAHWLLNVLVLLVVCGRGAWWIHGNFFMPLRQEAAAPPTTINGRAGVNSHQMSTDLENLVSSALNRCNASVVNALLGDAVAYSTQNRYLHDGFAVPASGLTHDGLAFKDLISASNAMPTVTLGADGDGDAKGFHGTSEKIPGLNTKYGNHLLMSLRSFFPPYGKSPIIDFEAFQRAWHQWQLQESPQDRGKAADIALKNLERGLVGRDAATLVGDIGATPRLPGIVAAFTLDVCHRLISLDTRDRQKEVLEETEQQLSQAAREMTMATHDRAEALVMSEFLARLVFRLVFQSILLPRTGMPHPLDRNAAPSVFWRAVRSVRRTMRDTLFIRRAYGDAERLCERQLERAPLGGELGGSRHLDIPGDLEDLGAHHTQELPTPQSSNQQRELFGLSGGINAALPAILYLAWKYERHPAAALTANALLGGNSAGRAVVLGMLLGARSGAAASMPHAWLAQLQSAQEALKTLSVLSISQLGRMHYTPCPAALCSIEGRSSRVVTSQDVQVSAAASIDSEGNGRGAMERYVIVELNVTNTGVTGLPVCLYGKLWLLWEAGGFARGRFRDIGDTAISGAANVVGQCLGPHQWKILTINITSGEQEALSAGPQHMVGLLEVVRPLRGTNVAHRMQQPGAGNLIQAVVVQGQGEEPCEHFAAKVGRVEIPPA